MLFVRFFVRSYLRRTSGPAPARTQALSKSSYSAVKGVKSEVFKAMSRDRGSAYNSTSNSDTELSSPAEPESSAKPGSPNYEAYEDTGIVSKKIRETASEGVKLSAEKFETIKREISQSVEKLENFDDLTEEARAIVSRITHGAKDASTTIANLTAEKAEKVVQELKEATSSTIKGSENKEGKDNTKPIKKEPKEENATESKEPPKSKSKKNKSGASGLSGSENDAKDVKSEESAEESARENGAGNKNQTKEEGSKSKEAAASYEASIDEVTSKEEKKAEAELQPDVVNEASS